MNWSTVPGFDAGAFRTASTLHCCVGCSGVAIVRSSARPTQLNCTLKKKNEKEIVSVRLLLDPNDIMRGVMAFIVGPDNHDSFIDFNVQAQDILRYFEICYLAAIVRNGALNRIIAGHPPTPP